VRHDVDVVQQCPAPFASALPAGRLVPGLAHLVLDTSLGKVSAPRKWLGEKQRVFFEGKHDAEAL
jgi:hypothetical protein